MIEDITLWKATGPNDLIKVTREDFAYFYSDKGVGQFDEPFKHSGHVENLDLRELKSNNKEVITLSDKNIYVECIDREEWDRVQEEAYPFKDRWTVSTFPWTINVTARSSCRRSYYENQGFTIISAKEYLKEFKVGDKVVCVDGKSSRSGYYLKQGDYYIVKKLHKETHLALEGMPSGKSYKKERFEVVKEVEVDAKVGDKVRLTDRTVNYCSEVTNEECTVTDVSTTGYKLEEGVAFYWYPKSQFKVVKKLNNQTEVVREEVMVEINPVIRKVFGKKSFALVEALNEEFGGEIPDTFQAEIDVERDKDLYVAELDKREKARAKAAKAAQK